MLSIGIGLGLTHGGKAAFSPASLFPAAGAWYDPSDLSTLFQDAAGTTPVTTVGQSVLLMKDKSGNGHDVSQAGGAGLAPTLAQQNGHNYLNFVAGSTQSLKSALWTSIPQPIDRICALEQDVWVANSYLFDGGVADEMLLRQNGVTPQLAIFAGLAAGTNGAATLSSPFYVAERFNGASSGLTIGSTAVTGDAGADGNTGITIGSRVGGGQFASFKLFGLIIRGGTLNAGQLANLHAWLSGKSGAA